MIKANELRIGNWVWFDQDSFPEQVRLETFAILFKYPERAEAIKPIPLTPEILEKAGLKKINDYYSLRVDEYIWLHVYVDGRYGFWSDSKENENNFEIIFQDNRIEFVHQLQRFRYFDVDKKEWIEIPVDCSASIKISHL